MVRITICLVPTTMRMVTFTFIYVQVTISIVIGTMHTNIETREMFYNKSRDKYLNSELLA